MARGGRAVGIRFRPGVGPAFLGARGAALRDVWGRREGWEAIAERLQVASGRAETLLAALAAHRPAAPPDPSPARPRSGWDLRPAVLPGPRPRHPAFNHSSCGEMTPLARTRSTSRTRFS
jgi:hypothetical protein